MDYSKIVEKIKSKISLVFILDDKGDILSKGSGFIFAKKGILVTCNHIVKQGTSIKIRFPDDEKYLDAKIAIRDEEHDLALLKFNDDVREPLPEADFSLIKEGIPVIFAGYPLSLFSLTTHHGMLSAIIKDATGVMTYLIDGTVNAGNSGCPLMTEKGEVIGIVNAKRRENSDILKKVEEMAVGAVSLYDVDIVKIYKALINNVQLGIGYAVPCSYVPELRDFQKNKINKDNNPLSKK